MPALRPRKVVGRCAGGRRAGGFTLLELLVTIALMVLLASVVIVSLTGPHRQAIWQNSIDRIAFIDRQLRARAQRFHVPLELVVDLEKGVLLAREIGREETEQLHCQLGGDISVKQALVKERRTEFGRWTVTCSTQGTTPTYALLLGDQRGSSRWLLFTGITGQLTELEHEEEVRALLSFVKDVGRNPA